MSDIVKELDILAANCEGMAVNGLIHAGGTADNVRRIRDEFARDSLDAAWAEAEAALPEGWRMDCGRNGYLAVGYHAVAVGPFPDMPVESGHSFRSPAAALRSLAARLRERAG